MKDGSTRIDAGYFNPIWKDIDTRLDKLENVKISWESAVQDLNAFGLERIDNVLAPVIQSTIETLSTASELVEELEQIIADADLDGDFAAQTASVTAQLEAQTAQVEAALEDALDTVEGALGGAVPTGAIIIWTGTACPAGWSRETALDGLFLKGASTAGTPNLTPSGSNTHVHTMSHDHTLGSHTHSTPSHTHTMDHTHSGTTGSYNYAGGGLQLGTGGAGIRDDHTHAFTTGSASVSTTSASSGTTGAAVGNTSTYSSDTGSASNEPQHVTVLFCKKD